MTDKERHSVAVLNEMLGRQKNSLLRRLGEIHTFVPAGRAKQYEMLKQMACDQAGQDGWLAEAIELMGGAIEPLAPRPDAAHLHYLALDAVLPRVAGELVHLAQLFDDTASNDADLTRAASAALRRTASAHRQHLQQLAEHAHWAVPTSNG